MDFDAIVVGAGPAGCLAARDLAHGGWKVGLFDAAPRERIGRPLSVEVESSVFRRVALTPPQREEIPYQPRRVQVFTGRHRPAFVVRRDLPTVALYLDQFVAKLLAEAERGGVQLFDEHEASRAMVSAQRVTGAVFRHRDAAQEVSARLVIDATGFGAEVVRRLDPVLGMRFEHDSRDVVLAANCLHDVDPDEAAEAVAAGLHGDEEVWATLGPFGAFSTEYSYLSIRKRLAYVLIGTKADFEGPPLHSLVASFRRRQGYFAECVYGGEGRIRVCRSLDRLVTSGFMVIGEAACTVHPLLGSGVTSALLSGHLAAIVANQALANPAPTTSDLWRYAARYQRGRGAVLASFDAARRVFESLSEADLAALLASGVVGPQDYVAVQSARRFSLAPTAVLRRTVGLARRPRLLPSVARLAAVANAVYRHYRRYPETFDAKQFASWRQTSQRLFAAVA
jgi:flavin-dependent dehydrogenase